MLSSILIWFMCKSVTLYEDAFLDDHVIFPTFLLLFQTITDLSLQSKDSMTMIIAQNVLPKNRYMKTDSTVLVHRDALL